MSFNEIDSSDPANTLREPENGSPVLPTLPPRRGDEPTTIVRMVRVPRTSPESPIQPYHPVFGLPPNPSPVPFRPAETAPAMIEPSLPTLAANIETYAARDHRIGVVMAQARELLTKLGLSDKAYPTAQHVQDLQRHAVPLMHVGLPAGSRRPTHFITIKYLPRERMFEFSDAIGRQTPEPPRQASVDQGLHLLIEASMSHYQMYIAMGGR